MIPRHGLLEMSWFSSPTPHQRGLCILPATALLPAACWYCGWRVPLSSWPFSDQLELPHSVPLPLTLRKEIWFQEPSQTGLALGCEFLYFPHYARARGMGPAGRQE